VGRPIARLALMATVLLLAATAAGCRGTAGPSAAPGAVRVVATTTILADMVAQVGGSHVTVESLVPKGGEVHTFDPTPSVVRRITEAQLIVRNGLGLDDWLMHLIANSGSTAATLAVGEDLPGVDYLAGGGEPGTVNPHLWLNAAYGKLYADRIAESLAAVDPAHATDYRSGAEAYGKVLAGIDADAKARLGAIPEANRTVISFHDAFPYFAAAYGLTIDGTVVDAPGQDPSAAQMEALVNLVKAKDIKAIFAEAQFNDDLVRAIARETGASVVSDLYTDTVGDAPVDTYAGMMRWNVDRVVAALTGG
jgi:ABC-type Zn uptake system ZnuABC Zn-binding protein ZnuA